MLTRAQTQGGGTFSSFSFEGAEFVCSSGALPASRAYFEHTSPLTAVTAPSSHVRLLVSPNAVLGAIESPEVIRDFGLSASRDHGRRFVKVLLPEQGSFVHKKS